MTSLTKKELDYINSFYKKEGDINILSVDEKERLCIISVPIFDGQEDLCSPHKIIKVPIDYDYYEDEEDNEEYLIFLSNVPEMLSSEDTDMIIEEIRNHYRKEKLYCIKYLSDNEILITDKYQIEAIQHRDSKERCKSMCVLREANEEDFKKYNVTLSCDKKYYDIPDFAIII